jgi:hypothetical protein
MTTNIEDAISEIRGMSEKTSKLVSRTKRLIEVLDTQTNAVIESMSRVKSVLGIEEKLCPICCKEQPTHCIDTCHHLYCHICCRKALRSGKCFICRQEVTAMFKVFLN